MPAVRTIPRLRVGAVLERDASPGDVRQQWLDHAGRMIATGGRDRGSWWMHWPGLATFWFDAAGDVRAEPEREGHDEEIRDIFSRGVTPLVLLARGFEALHASSVLADGGVVPLVGTSGTGKSTIALAIASTGLLHFADDTVVYRMIDGAPVALRLPFPVRVDGAARRLLPFHRPAATASPEGSAPLHRIYHLLRDRSVEPARPAFAAVPPNRRFELLLAHAHPFDMGSAARRRAFLENLMTVAATVEVWECRFAPDLTALPALAASIRSHIDGD